MCVVVESSNGGEKHDRKMGEMVGMAVRGLLGAARIPKSKSTIMQR